MSNKTLAIVSDDTYIQNLDEFLSGYLSNLVMAGSLTWYNPDTAKYISAAEAYDRIDILEDKIDSVMDSNGFWNDLDDPSQFEKLVLRADMDDLIVLVDYAG